MNLEGSTREIREMSDEIPISAWYQTRMCLKYNSLSKIKIWNHLFVSDSNEPADSTSIVREISKLTIRSEVYNEIVSIIP